MLNVLLQMLDDGRLTDGKGRTVDFKNTVVIMTSNLGSQYIAERAGASGDARRGHAAAGAWRRCARTSGPEFLNRIDEIVFFHALRREHLRQIVDIQLRGAAGAARGPEDHASS